MNRIVLASLFLVLPLLGACDVPPDAPCEGPSDRCLYDGGVTTATQAATGIPNPPPPPGLQPGNPLPYPVVPRWYNDLCQGDQQACKNDYAYGVLCEDPVLMSLIGTTDYCNGVDDVCGEGYLDCIKRWATPGTIARR